MISKLRNWLRLHLVEADVRAQVTRMREQLGNLQADVYNLKLRVEQLGTDTEHLSRAESTFTDVLAALTTCAAHGTKLTAKIAERFGGLKEFESE